MNRNDSTLLDYLFGFLSAQEINKLEKKWQKESMKKPELSQVFDVVDELAQAILPLEPGKNVKARLLDSVQEQSRFNAYIDRLGLFFDLPGKTLSSILQNIDKAPHHPWKIIKEGIFLLHFDGGPRLAEADCGLVYMMPHARFPCHRHTGDEYAFILQGEILDDNGNIMYSGDQMQQAENSQHEFTAGGKEAAIIAVVLNKGMEFIG